jgi:hypothetical protein
MAGTFVYKSFRYENSRYASRIKICCFKGL